MPTVQPMTAAPTTAGPHRDRHPVAQGRGSRPAYPDLAAVERELDLLTRMCAI